MSSIDWFYVIFNLKFSHDILQICIIQRNFALSVEFLKLQLFCSAQWFLFFFFGGVEGVLGIEPQGLLNAGRHSSTDAMP